MLAEAAAEQLGLAQVLFVPAGQPPHKPGQPLSPVEDRVAMVTAAIADNPRFALSRVDVDRPGPHYTSDMLALVSAEHSDTDLFLLIGGDMLAGLLTWHEPAQVIRQARLGVMRRPGATPDLARLAAELPGLAERLEWLEAPLLDIHASELRAWVRRGRSIRYLVPEPVREYIVAHGLYK